MQDIDSMWQNVVFNKCNVDLFYFLKKTAVSWFERCPNSNKCGMPVLRWSEVPTVRSTGAWLLSSNLIGTSVLVRTN